MTAGKGIVHAEMPIPNEDGTKTLGLQLWVDLPTHMKSAPPNYRDLREWEVPEVETDNGKVQVRVISGSSQGVLSLKKLAFTPVHYYHYTVRAGGKFEQELDPGFNYFIYVLRGDKLLINEESKVGQFKTAFLMKKEISLVEEMQLLWIFLKPKSSLC